MSRPAAVELLWLHASVTFARWRGVARRRFGLAGMLAGGLVAAVSGAMLLGASLAFGFVGTVLISTLASGDRPLLAALVAAALANTAVALSVLTVVLTDTERTGLDQRPLLLLPLAPIDRLVSDLLSILLLQPTAFVIWPSAFAVFAATVRHRPGTAWLALPAATGVVAVSATAGLLFQRLLNRPHLDGRPRPPSRALLRLLLLVLPLAWLALVLAPNSGESPGHAAPWSVGYWVGESLRFSWAGDHRALLFGLAPHLLSLGLLALAETVPRWFPSRLRWIRPWRPRWLPHEMRRIWGPARSRALLAQTLVTAGLVLALGLVLTRRGLQGFPFATATGIVAAWVLASGLSAMMANALGLGGRPGAGIVWVGAPLRRLLLPAQLAIAVPVTLLLVIQAWVCFQLFGDSHGSALALAAGLSSLLAGTGAGSLVSVVWPWPSRWEEEGDPVWPPGPGRLWMPVAQTLPLIPVVAALTRAGEGSTIAPVFATLLLGAAVAALCWGVAAVWLRRRLTSIAEALLG